MVLIPLLIRLDFLKKRDILAVGSIRLGGKTREERQGVRHEEWIRYTHDVVYSGVVGFRGSQMHGASQPPGHDSYRQVITKHQGTRSPVILLAVNVSFTP